MSKRKSGINVIGKDLGFEDVDSTNVRECLDSHSQRLTDTDLIELEQQRTYLRLKERGVSQGKFR
jgi:hypothetical protein